MGYKTSLKSLVASMSVSISSNNFFGVTGAYTYVVLILLCPNILLIVSIGTPASRVMSEANECRPTW